MSRAALAVFALLLSCQSQGGKPPDAGTPAPVVKKIVTDITAQDYAAPAMPHRRVTLTDSRGGKHVVDSEIANSRDQRTRGLMWRTVLPEGTGMLFIFEQPDELSFWMKNTLIPLDMIFIGEDLKVVGIVENAQPKTLSARTPGPVLSQYVLEVPGGWSSKVGIKAGSKIEVEDLASLGATP